MIEYELIKDTTEKSEDDYPEHVKKKLAAYRNAKLKYKIQEDGGMMRSIAFNKIKGLKPEKYYRNITQIIRLRSEDKEKEYIIYTTQEGCFDGGDREHNDSVRHGVDELIQTQPIYDTQTGALKDRTISVHRNVFTIPYSKDTLKKILDTRIPRKFKNEFGQEEQEHFDNPSLLIGILSNKYPALWESNEIYGIKSMDVFINDTFDDLLLMGFTGENTFEDALDKANEMIRTQTTLSPNLSKIKQQLSNTSVDKKQVGK